MLAVDFRQGLGRACSPPPSWLEASPEPASPGTQENWLAEEAESLMDFHCLIKVQLGLGAMLDLSVSYSSQVAQRACAENHLAKAEPRLWWGLSLAQEACSPAFWRPPGLIFRMSVLQALNADPRGISESEFKNWPMATKQSP